MPGNDGASTDPRRHLKLALRLAVGVSLLTLLFTRISWDDHVVLSAAGGATLELPVELRAPADAGRAPADARTGPALEGIGTGAGWSFRLRAEGDELAAIDPPAGSADETWRAATGRYVPGLQSSLGRLSGISFLLAFLLALAGTITASLRWKVLLAAVDLHVPLVRAVRLNLAGLAASQVLLGSVGGDIVKGALVTRDAAVPAQLGARTSAVLAMLMDRIVGLAALLTIGTAAALLAGGDLRELATWFGGALGLLLAGVVVVLLIASRTDARYGGTAFGRILHSLHDTLARYQRRPGALLVGTLLSFGSHSLLILAIALLGRGLDMAVPSARFFLLIPIVETAQAVPVSPAGWGVAESLYVVLFQEAGETASRALSLALSVRAVTLSQALLGIPGLVVLLRRRRRRHEPTAPGHAPPRVGASPDTAGELDPEI